MNVVVTGATGLIGRALVLRLLDEGHRVIAPAATPPRPLRAAPPARARA
jgi:uncharacterized protein YbjT (DUF2867 family)